MLLEKKSDDDEDDSNERGLKVRIVNMIIHIIIRDLSAMECIMFLRIGLGDNP